MWCEWEGGWRRGQYDIWEAGQVEEEDGEDDDG